MESGVGGDKQYNQMGAISGKRRIEMKVRCWKILTAALIAAMFLAIATPRAACADESTEARLRKLEATLAAVQQELAALKAEQSAQKSNPAPVAYEKQLDDMVAKAIDERAAEMGSAPSWLQDMEFFGDFRYRHEQINDTGESSSISGQQRDRNRIRARIGLKATINDEFDTIFRLASGSSDTPTSTNQTLGDSASDSFSSKEVWLDWAYFDYHPDSVGGLNVYGGKMKQPFYRVGKNQLVWDSDVSPEGVVGSYTFDLGVSNTATINAGGLWMRERSGDADSSFWGLQGLVKHDLGEGRHVLGGVSYYDMGNIEDHTLAGVSLNGNTSDGTGAYKFDYNLIEGFAEYGFPICEMPSAVFANYIENTAATSGNNNAFFIGCRLNKIGNKVGSWQLGYSYREVDPDAVFAGLTNSDIWSGGTGGKGHQLGFRYHLLKDVETSLSYYITERYDRPDQKGGDLNILHADMIFKF